MGVYEDKLQTLVCQDEERSSFIQELIDRVKSLEGEKSQLAKQLGLSQYLCQKQDEDLNNVRNEKSCLERSTSSDPFVLVLIDGDIALFADDYVRRASLGGHDAARDLRKAIYDYFRSTHNAFLPDTKVIIHVFANITGLSKTYQDAKLLSDPSMFRHFVQGFNKEHALCHFTDAGDDKEAADNKVKAEMELFHANMHCKNIMLAASGDNSYAGFMRQYCLTDQVSSRVVLIESIPFANQLEELSVKFHKTRLRGLFRDDKIEKRRVSLHDEKIFRQDDTPAASYASTVKQTNGVQDKHAVAISKLAPADGVQPKVGRKIFQNSKGQRVDLQINADRNLVSRLKPLKLCNRHFLTHCHYASCTHSHEGTLEAAELNALRFIARLSPCQAFQSYCEDADCVAGHRCMQGTNCEKGSKCWFSEDMHNVDIKIAQVIAI